MNLSRRKGSYKCMIAIFIFVFAAVIRLFSLKQSLWLDEGTTAQVVRKFGFVEIMTQFSPTDFHPPFYYLFMKLWTMFFGYSELSLRMPSVIFTLGTAYFIYKAAKHNNINTVWATAFFLFNPLIMYYSQEARMYAMITCLLSAVLYYYMSYKTYESYRSYITLDILIALSIFTFYGSVFFIGALFFHALITKKFSRISLLLPGTLGSLFILSPLLFRQYENAKSMLNLVPNWSLVLGSVSIKNLLLIPLKFSVGRIQWEPKTSYYLVAGFWSAFVFLTAAKGVTRSRIFGLFFIFPILLGVLFSFVTPLLQYFRFVYLIPLLSLLLTAGIHLRYQRIILLSGFIMFSFLYIFNQSYHREDWRSVASEIPDNSEVYMVFSSSDPLQYYFYRQNKSRVKIFDFSRMKDSSSRALQVVVIPYTSDIHGIDYEQILKSRGFVRSATRVFRGVSLERWEKIIYARRGGEAASYIR